MTYFPASDDSHDITSTRPTPPTAIGNNLRPNASLENGLPKLCQHKWANARVPRISFVPLYTSNMRPKFISTIMFHIWHWFHLQVKLLVVTRNIYSMEKSQCEHTSTVSTNGLTRNYFSLYLFLWMSRAF